MFNVGLDGPASPPTTTDDDDDANEGEADDDDEEEEVGGFAITTCDGREEEEAPAVPFAFPLLPVKNACTSGLRTNLRYAMVHALFADIRRYKPAGNSDKNGALKIILSCNPFRIKFPNPALRNDVEPTGRGDVVVVDDEEEEGGEDEVLVAVVAANNGFLCANMTSTEA